MRTPAQKIAAVAALFAFTCGVSGYFMGLLQTNRFAEKDRRVVIVSESPEVSSAPAAPRYSDLTDRTRQANHAWHSATATLPVAPAYTADTARLSPEEQIVLQAHRDSRRAYAGAPPTVPHPIDQHSSASCLACHGHPTRIGNISVPQISHPIYTNCIQCHAPAGGPGPSLASPPPALATPVLANTFTGLQSLVGGTRAFSGAPPTIPHTTAMRQNCVTCHAPGGSSFVKTTHPQRQNCLQCHALDATRGTQPVIVSTP
ncbi:MAG: hypothetical protein WC205_14285 [Opitutaceae bacterium]|jgi:cytochrome c-type protein NapB